MSQDEVMVLVVSLIIGTLVWARWFWIVGRLAHKGGQVREVGAAMVAWLVALPLVCLGVLLLVLATVSARDVRNDPKYIFMYTALGAAWVGVWLGMNSLFGVSARDDALERRNSAALPVVAGMMLGLTLAYAGANIGDGPGWWVVVFSAALSSAAVLLAWLLVSSLGDADEAVTVERDAPAGVRLGAMLVSVGLIAGRAAAGNWVSVQLTVADFVGNAWPAMVPVAVELLLLRRFMGSDAPPRARPTLGSMVAGAVYIGGAAAAVVALGPW